MSEEAKTSNKLTIIMLIVMFVSPILLSEYVFNYTDFLKMRGTSNHGALIDPPRALGDLALIDPLNDQRNDSLFEKWSLVYLSRTCDEACMKNVYLIRQIHTAMDKHSLRVQKVLFLTEQSSGDLKEQLSDYAGQQLINNEHVEVHDLLNKFKLDESDKPLEAGRIYIIDPLGNLMMSFKKDTNPRDIHTDLKKLLRGSRIG
jgi:cytochrome oxidase Cu insertion factor (SCO1/SenC/PrrC family)